MDAFNAKKIIVIGCPGSGKSTFARKLRDLTGLPLYYLDMLYHRRDRTTAPRDEFDAALKDILARDEWIIDGNYQRTLPLRLAACDLVFFFDLPLSECLEGAAARVGTVREDMPWVETEFDPDFRRYIIEFPEKQIPETRQMIEEAATSRLSATDYNDVSIAGQCIAPDINPLRVVTFASREEADRFISDLAD